MVSLSEIRDRAFESLLRKWGKAAMATFICGLLGGLPYTLLNELVFDGSGWVYTIFILPLAWGYSYLFLSVSRGGEVDYGKMFDGYKDFKRIFLTMLLSNIYEFLWSLLLIIPGIVKGYSYSMTPYILADDKDIRYDAAIEKSMKMMQGHKWRLFLLDLSFIGWFILCLLSLGIGFFWLIPYIETSHAKFYEELLAEDNEQ